MTAVDGDGIDEDLTRAVSVAMLAAGRAGEQLARMTQAAARERQARAAGDAVQAQRQVDAHTEAAKAYFEVVARPEYLSAATDEQVHDVARHTQAWRERLPEAQRAAAAATRELGARNPDQVDERAVMLAVEGDAADQRAHAPELAAPTGRVDQQAGRQAAATAEVAQALPAREAPASGRGRTAGGGRWPAKRTGRQTGIER